VPNQLHVTITDIAKRAGVSKTTVSRVLNNKPDVDGTTRERILTIIQETGYVPQVLAVGLATGRTGLIGLLVPSLSRTYSLEVIQGVAEGVEESEYELVLYTTSLVEKNQELFTQALSRSLTDGLVVLLPRDGTHYLTGLRDSHFPVVLIDHRGVSTGLPCVTASNHRGAYEATHYLIGLGHRQIGFLTGILDFGCSRDRLEGYQRALKEADLAATPELVKQGDFTEISGVTRAQELLTRTPPPTAIFCSNDEMALGALKAIRNAGLRVPEDISVIGFDDVPIAAQTTPALTTVKQPLRAMGRKAVEMVFCQIEGKPLDLFEVELQTELVLRESCQSPRR
jgi:LacI family transcriptional regulator